MDDRHEGSTATTSGPSQATTHIRYRGTWSLIDRKATVFIDGVEVGTGSRKKGFDLRLSTFVGPHALTINGPNKPQLPIDLPEGESVVHLRFDRVGNSGWSAQIETAQAPIKTRRFMTERLVFIVVAGIVLAPVAKRYATNQSDPDAGPVIAYAFLAWFLMWAIYALGKSMFGIGGFVEEVPPGTSRPRFDWRTFAAEPLRFLVVLIVFGFAITLFAVARSCSQ